MSYLVRSVLFMYAAMGLALLPCALFFRGFPSLALPALILMCIAGLAVWACMRLRRGV